MRITPEILQAIAPTSTASDRTRLAPHIQATMERYEINTLNRAAAFLAQILHESGALKYTEEIASGSAYEGRKDLGNTQAGDGRRFKGRGLIQITGRINYKALSNDLGVDLVNVPLLLEQDEYAALSAGWYWEKIKGNELADLPDTWRSESKRYDPFTYISYRVNGGLRGITERREYYERALKVLHPQTAL